MHLSKDAVAATLRDARSRQADGLNPKKKGRAAPELARCYATRPLSRDSRWA